ncbi:hypothetical protein Q3G72_006877 [Acer saccharum]|nr:hypothetical protein Q3G72_006877 [Acer saccharum]
MEQLQSHLHSRWNPIGHRQITLMARGYYVIHFSLEEDMRRIWASGTCTLTFGVFRLFQWKPNFDSYEPEIQTNAQVCIRIYGLCWEYLHPHILFEIAKGIGTPLHSDKATRDRTYRYYARILVDLDLSIDLPKSIIVEKIKSNNSVGGRKRSNVLEVYKPFNQLVEDKNKDLENSKKVLEEIRADTNCESLNLNHDSREIKEGGSSSKEIFNGTINDSKQPDGAGDVTMN